MQTGMRLDGDIFISVFGLPYSMGNFGGSQHVSIDERFKEFSDNYGPIPVEDRVDYEHFITLMQKNEISNGHPLDYVLLWSYVAGYFPVTDSMTGEKRRIQSLDDLVLLCTVNIRANGKKGKRNNPELYRLWGRMNERHRSNGSQSWREALSFLFNLHDIAAYFGKKPSYDKHVIAFEQKHEKRDQDMLAELKKYILGEEPITDQKTGKSRRIRHIDDLRLLSCKNVSSHEANSDIYNPKLYKIFDHLNDFENWHGSKGWGIALDLLFKDKKVVDYFGGRVASYMNHVVDKHTYYMDSEKTDRELLKQYLLGETPIVDRHTGTSSHIKNIGDLTLLSSANAKAKKDGKFLNSELAKLFVRINGRHHDHRTPNWRGTLTEMFRTRDVMRYFGQRPSYDLHVLETSSNSHYKRIA